MRKYAFFPGCMIPSRFPQFEASSLKVLEKLGIELERIQGWTCCPEPLSMQTVSKETWYAVAARNISLAEERHLDILTICNGCNETMFEVNKELKQDDNLRRKINYQLKKIGRTFKGEVSVKSILRVLSEDVGLNEIRNHVKIPLNNVKVAVHYGCHIFPELEDFDDMKKPQSLQKIVGALGAEVVTYSSEMACCAAFARPINEEVSLEFAREKLDDMNAAGADCIVVLCPYCFLQLDLGQMLCSRNFGRNYRMPVFYLSQLMGIAMGFSPNEMGLNFHAIKPENIAQKIRAIN
jgi:heterodisulfide reductase subunit B